MTYSFGWLCICIFLSFTMLGIQLTGSMVIGILLGGGLTLLAFGCAVIFAS